MVYTSDNLEKIHNEIKALKVAQPLNGGALTRHSVTATWTGTIDKNSPISEYSMLAAFKAKFERSDGVNKPPIVQFAYLLEPDMVADHHQRSYSAVVQLGSDSVTFKIILGYNWWPFGGNTTGTLKITAYAFSLVNGTLSLERVYS